jgi:hypothetical protein
MFSCLAIYVEDKIVFTLRDKRDQTADTGVWLATTEEHHQSQYCPLQGLLVQWGFILDFAVTGFKISAVKGRRSL